MEGHKVFAMKFSQVYPLYLQKAERKGRRREELDEIIRWLTGYSQEELEKKIEEEVHFEGFFAEAPQFNPKADLIRGKICGIAVEEIEDPLMKKIRLLDKLVDELAKGKAMETILRSGE
ncbi:MAG: DUF2200 domain-containing protein [Peptostreptococcaceae bacterium]|nr:DUF2200 domain-containing protein [Peptostreptococcaceae bacterium]